MDSLANFGPQASDRPGSTQNLGNHEPHEPHEPYEPHKPPCNISDLLSSLLLRCLQLSCSLLKGLIAPRRPRMAPGRPNIAPRRPKMAPRRPNKAQDEPKTPCNISDMLSRLLLRCLQLSWTTLYFICPTVFRLFDQLRTPSFR